MIDIRCTGCSPADDCVLVVAPKYCICTEGDTVSTDAGGFKQPAPTDTAEAAQRNPSLLTGVPRQGGEVLRSGSYTGENDTLADAIASTRPPVDQNTSVIGSDPGAPMINETMA